MVKLKKSPHGLNDLRMSTNDKPFVSVIMPVYNHREFVFDAAQSVLQQQDVDIELIVIDDASSDASWDVIESIKDDRVRSVRHSKNLGAHASLNEGLALAHGDWVAIINSDDLFHLARLARCIALMQAQGFDLVGTDIQLMDGTSQTVTEHWWLTAFDDLKQRWQSTHDWASTLLYGNVFMTTSNFVMRRSVLEKLGYFSAERYVHDYGYLLRTLAAGLRLGWLDEPLLRYRLHESNTISSSPLAANRECAALLRDTLAKLQPLLADPLKGTQRIDALNAQWARMDHYVDEIWAALQHHALVKKEQELLPLIHDRDEWIRERDQWIDERDQQLRDQTLWLTQKDELISQLQQWVTDRDKWITERDQWIDDLHVHLSSAQEELIQRNTQIQQLGTGLQQAGHQLQQAQDQLQQVLNSRSYRLARLLGWPVRQSRKLLQSIACFDFRASQQRWMRRLSIPHLPPNAPLLRVSSLLALRAKLDQLPPRIRCISFDVFDTLLARCVEPPDSLQRRVCAKIAAKLGAPHSTESVWQARCSVENELRHACQMRGGDHECHFEPLVERWVERLLGHADADLIAWVHRCERQLETLALSAKPGMIELLQHLRSRKLRIIAVSDMYLGDEHIRALLHDCGLGEFIDQLYVSADYGVGKYSGRLHAHVLEIEGLDADDIVHIGDNLAADMLAPLRLGVQGIFLDEHSERVRRRHQSLSADMVQHSGASANVWHGRHFFEVVQARQQLKLAPSAENLSFFQHYGRDVLGPAFAGFTLGLVERIRAHQPDKVFFLARDGYLFQQLYTRWGELLDAEHPPLPEACYAYVSRRVVAGAAIAQGMSHAQALVGLYNPKQHGLLSILKTYGLAVDDFREHALKHGFIQLDEPLYDWNDPRLLNFLADEQVQTQIATFGQSARADLETYFTQLGFFDCQRVALVDIGWSGTIQKFLTEAFAHRQDFPEVRGYYFAFVGQMHSEFARADHIDGLLSDVRNQNLCERTPGEFEELFEQGARALEATTLGYRRLDDGRVTPVLKDDSSPDRQGEIASNPHIAAMHQGALEHLEHFYAAHELTGYNFAQLKPYLLALLERAVVYPTKEEISQIGQLVHTEDFGHDHTLDIGNRSLEWRQFLLRPRRFMHELRLAPWRYAILARLPIPVPTWFYRMLWMRKQR